MENKEIVIKGKGIKVGILSLIFIVIGVITMFASIAMIQKIYTRYSEMMDSYQFEDTQRAASDSFKEAIDFLEEQARKFVVTGNIENARNYFEEKNITKRRESAIETIENSHVFALESKLLANAMELSELSGEYEIHAMALAAHAMNLDKSLLPEEIAAYELPQEEISQDSFKQQNLAMHLLYSDEYEDYKAKINWDDESAVTLVKDESATWYREAETDLIMALNITTALIFVLFVLFVLIFIFNMLLVVRPAGKFVNALNQKEKLPVIGGYELRKFARRYNDIYRSNKKNLDLLTEQGEVDELTGTLKVTTLEHVRHSLTQNNDPLGIMMVDIDNFRSLKEANGYEMADKLVAKVAKLLTKTFKSSDYIIRTGTDQFEVFLLRMQPKDSELVQEMVSEINKKLKDSADGIVAASVSVGVAFSENGYTEETERNADMALNYVKGNERGTCKIS